MKKFRTVKIKFQKYTSLLTAIVILVLYLTYNYIFNFSSDNPEALSKVKNYSFYLNAALFILFSFTLSLLVKKLTKPLLPIQEGLEKIETGELEHRLQIETKDEFFVIADKINMMADRLGRMAKDFKKTRQNLENEIQKRSKLLDETHQKLKNTMEELINTQKKVIQTEKQKSLTAIVAGFAHEINNPLTGILGYIDLMELRDDISPYLKDKLALIKDQSIRIRNILKELNQLNPEIGQAKLEIDLSNLLEKLIKIINMKHDSENIQLKKQFIDEPIFVIGNHFSLWQVFEGIVENAVEAIVDNQTRDGIIDIQLKKSIDQSSAIVEIRDNGGGFENIDKAFDPFYTTKSRTQKKGIGLSIAYNIIQEHQGNILISNGEEGAVITVYVPLSGQNRENQRKETDILGE